MQTFDLSTPDALAASAPVMRQHGPHRFVEADGHSGYHPTTRDTELTLDTDLLRSGEWAIGLWVCPLEDLDIAAPLPWIAEHDPEAARYPLITDAPAHKGLGGNVFGWYWTSQIRPAMLAKLVHGTPAPGKLPASTQVEQLLLSAATWYRFVLTYSESQKRMCIWVNGVLAGISEFDFTADTPGTRLHIGNPAMTFGEIELHERALDDDEVKTDFDTSASPRSREAADRLRPLFEPRPGRTVDWHPSPEWVLRRETDFTRPEDIDGWTLHGCQQEPYGMKELRTTPEGLLLQTPDEIADESRMYLWSPETFEGDLAVSFDFRMEQDSGFGMLVTHAAGMQREDVLADPGNLARGAMQVINRNRLRNYYWGFYRRTPTTPKHLASHTLVKNPWARNLALSASENITVGEWHTLLFLQQGGLLRGAIDGEWVVEGHDDPHQNHGPVLSAGRIALRLMYQTRMRVRGLRVWTRSTGFSVAASGD
ncbi:DUF1961 family protein [Microbacterium sp. JB110]|uniref:DUF1961 family protein n=1 Tax=Microbacterium sp. JB110 TaxID=2024477 RepID=UPI00097E8230|nr:DUF1961 family protein [Microbacterium sp. JB110]RCS60084.1 DUF1961 family protein [Microbacterium sp. JB110]SJM45517.1 hypothetical protein CZ774_02210 [Frigoribacterium sp. JB110]